MIESLQSIDRSLFLSLNRLHISWLDPVMNLLSGQALWIPFIGFFFWSSWKKNGKVPTYLFGLFLLLTLIASDVSSSYIIKNLVNRMRPCRLDDLKPLIYSFGQKCGGKFGFVSSHAANSLALVLFSLRTLSFRQKTIYALLILPFLVSWSRIYLGVHYPGDILGGFLVGTFWAMVFSALYKNILRR